MSPRARLSPAGPRFFPGQRWVNVSLRTLHLIGVAGLGAGFMVPGADQAWRGYLPLTLLTGIGLSAIFAWSDRQWIWQLAGQATLLKVLLLALIPFWTAAGPALFVAVIVISGVTSHAPARVRHYLVHRRG